MATSSMSKVGSLVVLAMGLAHVLAGPVLDLALPYTQLDAQLFPEELADHALGCGL